MAAYNLDALFAEDDDTEAVPAPSQEVIPDNPIDAPTASAAAPPPPPVVVEAPVVVPAAVPVPAAAPVPAAPVPAAAPAISPSFFENSNSTEVAEVPIAPPAAQAGNSAPPASLMVASWGTVVNRYPIDRFKAVEGPKQRFAIPMMEYKGAPMLIIGKTHWTKDLGRFYCLDRECCEIVGIPDVYYYFPIIVYDTDKRGIVCSADFEIQFFRAPKAKYDEFVTYVENGVDLTTHDFVVNCTDSEFQKMSFQCFPNAVWRRDQNFARVVLEKLLHKWSFMNQVIARKLSREKFLEKSGIVDMGDAPAAAAAFNMGDFMKGDG